MASRSNASVSRDRFPPASIPDRDSPTNLRPSPLSRNAPSVVLCGGRRGKPTACGRTSRRGIERRMPDLVVPLRAVVALFLERQHLARPRAQALTAGRLTRFVEDVGGLQIDSINVLDRAHYLTVWSRFGSYDRARLDRLVYRRRLLFEYWAHAACLVSASTLPWWRRAMLDYRTRHTGWSGWLRRNPRLLAEVKAAVERSGPMANGDFDAGRRRNGKGGWWSWQPFQHALHHLWMTGVLTVHSRRHFQKRFDLLERAMPGAAGITPVPSVEFHRWHVERSLHAMGAATDRDLAGYPDVP